MNPPRIGTLPAGPRDAISDVGEIRVGHVTLDLGAIQTGVTVVLPHGGDLFRDRVPGACAILNGFGKSVGLELPAFLGKSTEEKKAPAAAAPAAATQAAIPRSRRTVLDLAETTADPCAHSRICGPSWTRAASTSCPRSSPVSDSTCPGVRPEAAASSFALRTASAAAAAIA